MAVVSKFQNFQKFLDFPKESKLRFIGLLSPDQATVLANEYQSRDDVDTDVWARMLEQAAPDIYSEQCQPAWLRGRILATREGRDETLRVIESDDGKIDNGEESNKREDAFCD